MPETVQEKLTERVVPLAVDEEYQVIVDVEVVQITSLPSPPSPSLISTGVERDPSTADESFNLSLEKKKIQVEIP